MISAIVTTYNPDLLIFAKLIESVHPQVDNVVVVDNGSSPSIIPKIRAVIEFFPRISLIENSQNNGVAAALNQGFNFSVEVGADYVLLLDQDSLPAFNMVHELLLGLQQKISKGEKIGAVGPNYSVLKGAIDPPFVKLHGHKLVRVDCSESQVVSVDHLITSGSLIPVSAWLDIGGMEEGLFISYVDTEWCIRATMKGYQLYGVGCAGMIHDLGDDVSHFFGQTVPIYSPLRYYYTFRNSVWLIRCDWVPIEWKIVSIKRSMVFYIVYSLFLGRRFANWKMMMRGLWHGVKGKDGIIR